MQYSRKRKKCRAPNTKHRTYEEENIERRIPNYTLDGRQQGGGRGARVRSCAKNRFNAQRPTSNVQRKRQPRFDLEERLLEFSARIIRLVDALSNTRAGNHVAGQLLRSGTSPYGNHGEVEAAESRKDFVHKLKVCLKELKETRRWLRLIERSRMIPEKSLAPILTETEELIRIFFTSIRTAEQNAR
jgi:four helix bundle protein